MSLSKLDHDSLASILIIAKPLAHDLAKIAVTCRDFNEAVKKAFKLRPYYSEVVTFYHTDDDTVDVSVAAAPDGRVITSSWDSTVKVWLNGVCERTIEAHTKWVKGVAVRSYPDTAAPFAW